MNGVSLQIAGCQTLGGLFIKFYREIKVKKTENNGAKNGKDKRGRFLPGNPGKPKGSSKNKLRDQIRKFINDNWESLPDWFEKLKPKEKIDTILALLPYSVSRLQSISMTDSDGNDKPGQRTVTDFSKLSETTLKEILKNTHYEEPDTEPSS